MVFRTVFIINRYLISITPGRPVWKFCSAFLQLFPAVRLSHVASSRVEIKTNNWTSLRRRTATILVSRRRAHCSAAAMHFRFLRALAPSIRHYQPTPVALFPVSFPPIPLDTMPSIALIVGPPLHMR